MLIARSKLPAFIATLGMMKILRSVTQQVMQTAAVKVPSSFLAISNTKIGGEVILPILYWLVAAVILHIVSRYTPFGRHVYAVGSNERTARLSGVNVERVKGLIYVLMGALVAVTCGHSGIAYRQHGLCQCRQRLRDGRHRRGGGGRHQHERPDAAPFWAQCWAC